MSFNFTLRMSYNWHDLRPVNEILKSRMISEAGAMGSPVASVVAATTAAGSGDAAGASAGASVASGSTGGASAVALAAATLEG